MLEPQDQWLSTAVSRIRQPIETLFGWIEKKQGLNKPEKYGHSLYGLIVHVFGKLAAAMFFGIICVLMSALNSHLNTEVLQ